MLYIYIENIVQLLTIFIFALVLQNAFYLNIYYLVTAWQND